MAQTVFILGAGASKEAGAPLMLDFLNTAERLLRDGHIRASDDVYMFELVQRGIKALDDTSFKVRVNTDNLEDVFGAFEMAQTLGSLPPLDQREVDGLTSALRRLIVVTLEETIGFRVVGEDMKYALAPEPYGQFVSGLTDLQSGSLAPDIGSIAIVSLNYDLCIDYALHNQQLGFDYSLSSGTESSQIPLLKLHGSLNWYESDGEVVPLGLAQYFEAIGEDSWPVRREWGRLCVGSKLPDIVGGLHTPLIVPPTWSKSRWHEPIGGVWKRAGEELADAENIFVIGYSLPRTDEFFRFLLSVGLAGSRKLRRFFIVNTQVGPEIREKFKGLLGEKSHAAFEYPEVKFSWLATNLRHVFATTL